MREGTTKLISNRILRRILCWILVVSLVSQNGMQTVSARTDKPNGKYTQTENTAKADKDKDKKYSSDNVTDTEGCEQSEILKEIEGRRTAFTKEYLRSDNSRTLVVYPQQVHFETGEGTLEEIDNSLVQTGEGYENGNNSYKLVITDNAESQGEVIYREDGYEIAWQLVEVTDAGTQDGAETPEETGEKLSAEGYNTDGEDIKTKPAEAVGKAAEASPEPLTPARVKAPGEGKGENSRDKGETTERKRLYRPRLKAKVTEEGKESSGSSREEEIHRIKQFSVTFKGYAEHVSLEYAPAGDGVKENLILEKEPSCKEYLFTLHLEGLGHG